MLSEDVYITTDCARDYEREDLWVLVLLMLRFVVLGLRELLTLDLDEFSPCCCGS